MINRMMQKNRENSAVTDVVGTMLLIAISLGLFSIVYISVLSVPYTPPTPTANIACLVDGNTIILEHYGGDELDLDTKILLSIDGESSVIDIENMDKSYNWDLNNNNKWNVGEKIEYDAGILGGKEVNVQIIDSASNSIVTMASIPAKNPILTAIDNILFEQYSSPITLTASSTGIEPENVTLWYKWGGYWQDSFENDDFVSMYHNITFSNGDYATVNLSGLGENIIDYVDSDSSNVDGSKDIGSHSNFSTELIKDSGYDELVEENTNDGTIYNVDDDSSNVDGVSDSGSHNDFIDQQSLDGSYDVLTEENTEGGSVVTTLLSDDFESGLGNWNTDWDLTYSFFNSPYHSVECSSSDHDLITHDLDTSGASSISVSFKYRIHDISGNDNVYVQYFDGNYYHNIEEIGDDGEHVWLTYSDTITNVGGDAQYFRSNFRLKIAGSGVDPNEYLWVDDVLIEAEVSNVNYQLDLEVQWLGLDYNKTNEYLCIYAGTLGSENINVDVWNVSESRWDSLFNDLSAGWNNISVTDWLTSSTFTIRYQGATESSDSNQDTWQIDVALIHVWDYNYKLDLEVQWTNIADITLPNKQLCIYTGDLTAESLGVDYWTGSAWNNLDSELDSFQWNNYTVPVTSDEFIIRFIGGSEVADKVADNWQIDAVLLHLWRQDGEIYYEGNISSIPIKKPSSCSWDSFYATTNNSEKCTFEIHDALGNVLKDGLDGSGNVITSEVTEDIIYLYGEFNGSVRLDDWKITLTGQGWQAFDIDDSSPWKWEFSFENVEEGFTLEYWFYSIGKKTGWSDEQKPDSPSYDTRCQYQP